MIQIINGPNLNLLGKREPEIYGTLSFEDYLPNLQANFHGIDLQYFQSNSEGDIIQLIQNVGFNPNCQGIILNAGGYSHTSVAIADAVAAINAPVIEVHISNIYAREEFRRHSIIAPYSIAQISGCDLNGYELAIRHLLQLSDKK